MITGSNALCYADVSSSEGLGSFQRDRLARWQVELAPPNSTKT
jgi:hypothetical protein